MLYEVIETFECVGETLKCDHSNESYWVVLSCGTVHWTVKQDLRPVGEIGDHTEGKSHSTRNEQLFSFSRVL